MSASLIVGMASAGFAWIIAERLDTKVVPSTPLTPWPISYPGDEDDFSEAYKYSRLSLAALEATRRFSGFCSQNKCK